MYSCGPPHMANQKQDDQLEHTYSSYVMIWDVTLKTCWRWWMIGRRGERGSGISVLAARHDDNIYVCVCVCVYIHMQTTPDDSLWKVQIGTILINSSTNFNLKQDTYQDAWKDLKKLYRQSVSLLFNQTYLNERLLPNLHIYKVQQTDLNLKLLLCKSL